MAACPGSAEGLRPLILHCQGRLVGGCCGAVPQPLQAVLRLLVQVGQAPLLQVLQLVYEVVEQLRDGKAPLTHCTPHGADAAGVRCGLQATAPGRRARIS